MRLQVHANCMHLQNNTRILMLSSTIAVRLLSVPTRFLLQSHTILLLSSLHCSLVDFAKRLAVYVAGHELHVCATFSRSFFWSDLNLWPEDLRPGSVVLLSGRDDLMNAQQVKEMLERSGHVKVNESNRFCCLHLYISEAFKPAAMLLATASPFYWQANHCCNTLLSVLTGAF